jgi:DNA primase large subunit
MLKQKAAGSISIDALKQADSRLEMYPSTLNFYNVPPQDEVSLFEFETYALDRLKVLRAVETARIRCKGEDEINRFIDAVLVQHLDLKRNMRLKAVGAQVLFDERRKDHISHFILRLAYCKNEDLRNWFVRQEATLFKVPMSYHRFVS